MKKKETSFGVKLLAYITVITLSWALSTGILFLASLCFRKPFDLSIATGVWLILMEIRFFLVPVRSKN